MEPTYNIENSNPLIDFSSLRLDVQQDAENEEHSNTIGQSVEDGFKEYRSKQDFVSVITVKISSCNAFVMSYVGVKCLTPH